MVEFFGTLSGVDSVDSAFSGSLEFSASWSPVSCKNVSSDLEKVSIGQTYWVHTVPRRLELT
jgi:hypothetical protein